MKKHGTFKASSSILGFLLLISLFGTVAMTSLDAFADFYSHFKTSGTTSAKIFRDAAAPHRFPHLLCALLSPEKFPRTIPQSTKTNRQDPDYYTILSL